MAALDGFRRLPVTGSPRDEVCRHYCLNHEDILCRRMASEVVSNKLLRSFKGL